MIRLDCFFWVTVQPVTVELVAGAGSHQTAVGFFFWVCCFPGGWVLWCVVMLGWFSCPYFENCIVDASISL